MAGSLDDFAECEMKRRLFLGASVITAALTGQGCFLGEPALYGEAYEKYQRAIKPYAQYWEKPGANAFDRRKDARQCGTADTDYAMEHVVFDKATLLAARANGENSDAAAYDRVFYRWERCMLDKGYTFNGECPDTEVSRAKPACANRLRQ